MNEKEKKTLLSALAVAFLDNFGYSFVFILFAPLVLNPEYGFFSGAVSEGSKNLWLGVLIGAFPVFTFFGAPFWGDFADRFGRKKALIWTILGTAAGHFLSALAIYSQSYFFLLATRAAAGFFSGNISICLATVSDLSPTAALKSKNFGMVGVVMGIGWILAMVLGGDLSDPKAFSFASPAFPFFLTAAFTLGGYLAVKAWFSETHEKKEGVSFDWIKSVHDIKDALKIGQMRPFLFTMLFWSFGWFFTFQWFTAISIERFSASQETASFYLVLLGFCWMIGGVAVNPFLVKRFNTRLLALASIFATGAIVLAASFSSSYPVFSILFALCAFAAPVSFSNCLNLVSLSAPDAIQGKAMGFSQSFQAAAGIAVPLAGGLIAQWNIGAIFPLAAAFLFITFLILLVCKAPKKAG